MAWSINGTRIYVQELRNKNGQILPRLQPLNGGTVIQRFGYESDILECKAIVVGYTDHNAVKDLTTTGDSYTLLEYDTDNPIPFSGQYYVKGFSSDRSQTFKQTIRGDLDCYAPTFSINLELYPND